MNLLPREEIKTLIERPKDLCVSIFLPTHPDSSEIRQDPVRLKNLTRQAEERLVESGLRPEIARDLLKPATELDRGDFWQQQGDGLALFLAPDLFRCYRVPLDLEELVVVTDRFHLKPLLPLLSGHQQFYILALSQHSVRLLQATRYRFQEVELPNVPANVDQALRYDDTGKPTQFRSGTSRGGATNPQPQAGASHGQGSPETDNNSAAILQYFHQINDGLQALLQNEQAPLVLAGVEYLLPLYQSANTYPHLIDPGVLGNPENTKLQDLHSQAWTVVEPYLLQPQQEAASRYQELKGTEQASAALPEIVPAALYGRVDSLFVPVKLHQWGLFDSGSNEVQLHPEMEPGDEDLLDLAAVHTFLNHGSVYAIAPEQIPDGAQLAAVFRY